MSGIYSTEELKKVQQTAAEILKMVVDYCDENNIRYFVAFGTALGAMRHGGFIPWDDDIDICMPREDYDRFLKIAYKPLLDNGLVLQSFETDTKCPDAFAKVRKMGTRFVEYYNRFLDIELGVFIDIFPFDSITSDEKKRRRQFNDTQKWLKLFAYRQTPELAIEPIDTKGYVKRYIRKAVFYLLQLIPAKVIYDHLTRIIKRYNNEDIKQYGSMFYPRYDKGYISKESVEHPELLSFEGIEVKAPGNVDKYLRELYGDYMKLPPENERVGHRPYEIHV